MKCPLCGKRLVGQMMLVLHIQSHMKEGSDTLARYAEVEFVAGPPNGGTETKPDGGS